MPPNNAGYYEAAYAAAIAVYGLYTLLLWRRRARVRAALRAEEKARDASALPRRAPL
jgi:hypothetical protein